MSNVQPKEFIVYMATNRLNGNRYIGATRKGLHARRRHHFKDAKRSGKTRDCPRFYDAIRKYGDDAFDWSIITTLSTSEEMYKEEERLIALLKPEYNIASGGLIFTSKERQKQFSVDGANRSCKPVICLNDGLVYQSGAAAARAYNVEKKSLMQLCNRGGIGRNGLSFALFTEPMSLEDRESLLSERQLHKMMSEQARINKVTKTISRPVTDLNTGAIYTSARAADKALNLSYGTAEACCRRGRANRSGDCFAFGELSNIERHQLWEEAKAKRRAVDVEWKKNLSKMRSRFPPRQVKCNTYGITFRCAEAAAMEYCIPASSIREACGGKDKKVYGLKFSYIESYP